MRRREVPDEVRAHAVAQCPDCGRRLEGACVHRRWQVLEVVLSSREIEHVVLARRCGVCAQALVAVLRGRYRMPMAEIGRFLQEGWGLHVSDGEVVALLDGAAQPGEAKLGNLLEQVRSASVVRSDETG